MSVEDMDTDRKIQEYRTQEQEELTPSEREELEQLRREKEKNMKERLYDKVNVSVKTLDRIIFVLVILFLVVVLLGIFAGN